MQRLPEAVVRRETGVVQGLIEACDRPLIHILVLPVATVESHDRGLVAEIPRVGRWSAECLGPVRCQPTGMVGTDSVAEGVANDVIGQDSGVPCLGQSQQTVVAARCVIHAAHG